MKSCSLTIFCCIKNSVVIDLGCGCGRNTIFYAQNGFDTYALDKSEYAVKYTKEISKIHKLDINIQTGDMLNMPYENEFFDCILCRNVISHTDTEGIKVGIKQNQKEIAIKMLQKQIDIKTISEITGLTEEAIKKLQK